MVITNPLAEQIINDFAELKRLYMVRIMSDSGLKLPPAQTDVVLALYRHGPKSVKGLADVLHISSAAVTQLVDPLVERGLVERQTGTADRRITNLCLTEASTQRLGDLRTQHMACMKQLLARLTDEEQRNFAELLHKIISLNTKKEL